MLCYGNYQENEKDLSKNRQENETWAEIAKKMKAL